MNHLFSGPYRQPPIDDLSCESSLLVWVTQRQKRSRVTSREPSFPHKLLKIVRQAKQTQVIRDVRSVAANSRRQSFLGETHRLDQLLVSLRLLDRIEILALNILNQSDLEKALIGHLLNDYRHSRQSREFRGAPTSL